MGSNDVLALFATVDRELGSLTALVNNAGVVDLPSRVDEMSEQRLRRMLDINVLGSSSARASWHPWVPMQRPGTAAEVAQAIVWLLGDGASYTTGSIVDETGGR